MGADDGDAAADSKPLREMKYLLALVTINLIMFGAELWLGWVSESAGLIADSFRMLSDAVVYVIALTVVGRGLLAKAWAAGVSGVIEILLGAGMIVEILRRALVGSDPKVVYMIFVSLAAMIANIASLVLASAYGRHAERPNWAFAKNDVQGNLGVVAAGALVTMTGSSVPDLVIACLISAAVLRSGVRGLRQARD